MVNDQVTDEDIASITAWTEVGRLLQGDEKLVHLEAELGNRLMAEGG